MESEIALGLEMRIVGGPMVSAGLDYCPEKVEPESRVAVDYFRVLEPGFLGGSVPVLRASCGHPPLIGSEFQTVQTVQGMTFLRRGDC